MRLHRFFVKEKLVGENKVFVGDTGLTHQLRHVFRFTVGGQVVLLDGTGMEYHAMITEFKPDGFEAEILSEKESQTTPQTELYLFCAIAKKDKFEWIVEKGTEIGVSKFIPLISQRSEKKNLNFERLGKIAKEAVEQSGRAVIPEISEITKFDDAISWEIPMCAFSPEGENFLIEKVYMKSPLGVFVGPEGGWSSQEIKSFKDRRIPIYSLSKATLRTETAAIAAATLILFG